MKKVFLHGFLADGISSEWDLMIESPSEAIRAINCNTQDRLLRNICDSHDGYSDFVILRVNSELRKYADQINSAEKIKKEDLDRLFIDPDKVDVEGDFDELHFIPRVRGQIFIGATMLKIGVAIGKIGTFLKGLSIAKMAFMAVGGMLVAGIAAAMFPPVKKNDQTMRTKSYMFGGRENLVEQGGAVPVGYGMLKVGSSSLGLFVQNRFLPGSIDSKSIESYTQFHITDIISEGPIAGFCDTAGNILNDQNASSASWDNNQFAKSIYINDLPIKNDSNQMNFIPSEDNPIRVPQFSLGEKSLSKYLSINPRVEYESGHSGSALPGPNFDIAGFYPEMVSVKAGEPASRWGAAKAHTHPVTDRNIGMVTFQISSEGQFHNWTDQRVRRRWFSRRVSVTRGTDAVQLTVALRMFDGKKFIPPIANANGNLLEGIDPVSVSSGVPATSKYYMSGMLTKSDIRDRVTYRGTEDLFRFFTYAIFDDSRTLSSADQSQFDVFGFTRRDLIYSFINNAEQLVELFSGLNNYTYTSQDNDSFPNLFAGDNSGTSYTIENIFDLYFNQNKRLDLNGSLETESSAAPGAAAILFAGLYAEIKTGEFSALDVFRRFFHEVMTLVKREVVDEELTLGSDGNIYYVNRKLYYKPSDLVRKSSISASEEASGLWTYTPAVTFPHYGLGYVRHLMQNIQDDYWTVLSTSKTISQREYNTLSNKADYTLWDKAGHIKNQSILVMKGVSTAPASVDYSFQLPYIVSGEAISIQSLRCSAEVTDVQEMATTSKRMSLKGVRRHKCLQGQLMRFNYPGTSWIKTYWDSVNFQQIPNRNYLVKLKKVPVPENYNPETRTYIGPWNGLFKGEPEPEKVDGAVKRKNSLYRDIPEESLEWTDNPAWILLDIMLNPRFGVGRYGMTLENIDRWHLYAAAKFCDELVETGLPLETSKRYFETYNYSTKTNKNDSYFGSKERYLAKDDTFYVRIYSDKFKSGLKGSLFLDEFNDSVFDRNATSGRFVAFFMSDGSIQRRKIARVLGTEGRVFSAEGVSPTIAEEKEDNAQYLELYGPTFIDHDSTDSSKKTHGFCCIEKSYPLVEPRFSLNVYYNKQQRALETIREIISQFRTVLNYIGGKISFSTEKKSDPVLMFTDANVSEEGFSYAGTAKSSRVTAAKVRYIDKFDGYKSKLEYYEDPGGIDKFGYSEEEVLALGCTSRSQAYRLAKFMVLAPNLETEVVSFSTGMEGAMLLPGSVIEISDSRRFGENINGRIKAVNPDDYAVKVDKIMSNLSFWDPETGMDSDRVELCVVSPMGFEDPNKVSEGVLDKVGLPKFTEFDQVSMISDVRRSQMVYFDGFISENKREIRSLVRKERFEVNANSDVIVRSNHGLSDGDSLRFSSFGVLPKYKFLEGGVEKEERLDESQVYYVVSASDSNSSFKISKIQGGDPLDFIDRGYAMRATFNSSEDVDARAEISGGEHFYSRFRRVDGRDETKEALEEMMIGSAWSIRGFKKDVFLRPESISEDVKSNFLFGANGLNAKEIKGKKYSYFSEMIGSFSFSGQASDSTKGTVLAIKQSGPSGSGLGSVLINVDNFSTSAHIDLPASLGQVKLVDANTIAVTENSSATTLFRSSLDTDVFRVISTTSNDLYLRIRDRDYLIRIADGHRYIRLSGIKPTANQVNQWVENLGGTSIPALQAPTAPPQDTVEISIDDFRNVGRRQYRVNSVSESDYGAYEVKASEYNREKFSIIENEISLNRPTLPIPPQVSMEIPLPPKDFSVKDTTYRGVINV